MFNVNNGFNFFYIKTEIVIYVTRKKGRCSAIRRRLFNLMVYNDVALKSHVAVFQFSLTNFLIELPTRLSI